MRRFPRGTHHMVESMPHSGLSSNLMQRGCALRMAAGKRGAPGRVVHVKMRFKRTQTLSLYLEAPRLPHIQRTLDPTLIGH